MDIVENTVLLILFEIAIFSLILFGIRVLKMMYKRKVVPVVSNTTEYVLPPLCVGWILRQPNPKYKRIEWLPTIMGDDPDDVWRVLEGFNAPLGRIVLPYGEHPLGKRI